MSVRGDRRCSGQFHSIWNIREVSFFDIFINVFTVEMFFLYAQQYGNRQPFILNNKSNDDCV